VFEEEGFDEFAEGAAFVVVELAGGFEDEAEVVCPTVVERRRIEGGGSAARWRGVGVRLRSCRDRSAWGGTVAVCAEAVLDTRAEGRVRVAL